MQAKSRKSARIFLRSAVLAGVLNAVLDEKVNVVNAPAVAASRGLSVEEETRRREHGFPNTLEVSTLPEKPSGVGFTAEGTVLHDGSRACWRLTEFLSKPSSPEPSFICAITMNPVSSVRWEALSESSA